jgi:vacuolar-type H+-ATPase subunit H
MPLESIVEEILREANSEKGRIIESGQKEAEAIIQEAKAEADKICQDIIAREKQNLESEKQRSITAAKLQERKKILEAKQEMIKNVFLKIKGIFKGDIKKVIVSRDRVEEEPLEIDVFLDELRRDYETEIAKILFDV